MVVGELTIETDVVVIGSGPGGYVAAIRAAQLGKEVVIVERDSFVGGVCLNTGCIPTKAMIHASNFFNTLQHLESMGINVKEYSIDLKKMKDWKDSVLEKLRSGIDGLLKKYGIEVIQGKAEFTSSSEIHIEGKSDVNTIKFKFAIIATGSSAIEIPGFKYDGRRVISSTEGLDLNEVPKSLVIIGGGYIGTEMGTVFGKLGTKVSIVEAMDRLIPVVEKDLVDVVARRLEKFNVKTHFNCKAKSYEEKGDGVVVRVDNNGSEVVLEADKVMVVVGRKPNSSGIGLERAGVKVNEKGFILVDKKMRTSSNNIFAIGDVVGNPMLAHKASREGKIAAEVVCGLKSEFDNKVIPFVVFNDPEIASVGLTEDDAKKAGYDIIVGRFPFSALGRAMTLNQTDGFVKFVSEKKTGFVLGVHAVGPNASDIISEAALAIEMNATVEDIAATIHPHPTLPESLMEAAEVTLGKSIHIYMPKKQ